jgi:hypothetical protein
MTDAPDTTPNTDAPTDDFKADAACFYVPGRPGLVSLAVERDGETVSTYGKTIEELAVDYPGVQLGKVSEVHAASCAMFRSAPTEITRERFQEMLELLPPVAWTDRGATETFKMCERTYGPITAIFCRIGDRYYEMSDDIRMPHEKIVAVVVEAMKQTRRRLKCCICGGEAGRWSQWWNRDDGFGVCAPCVDRERSRGATQAEISSRYGTEGINWGRE